ncbi:uncharacterized protein LOC144912127 isoform X2 [Branchiostoma floridae x Branchiostoma belcheri]|nr:hypothetical protein Bbelb_381150 [Branchiostoma belcheri]
MPHRPVQDSEVQIHVPDTTQKPNFPQRISNFVRDKGNISLIITFVVTTIALTLFLLVQDVSGRQVVSYFLSGGLFGFAGGFTNWLAVVMLFTRIPGVYGSGVIPNRYREIRAKVKEVIMEMFFDEEFLEKYLSHKLMEVANNVDMKAKVGEIVHSKTVDRLIDEKLASLGTTPEGQLILKMGVDPKSLKPMIKPFLQGFGEDLAPMIKETLSDPMQVIDVSKLRKEMEKYMNSRMETLTEQRVTSLLEAVIRPHLGWIIVWGCVFGGLIGIITQAVGLAPSY